MILYMCVQYHYDIRDCEAVLEPKIRLRPKGPENFLRCEVCLPSLRVGSQIASPLIYST
jgi:hypothetical protein